MNKRTIPCLYMLAMSHPKLHVPVKLLGIHFVRIESDDLLDNAEFCKQAEAQIVAQEDIQFQLGMGYSVIMCVVKPFSMKDLHAGLGATIAKGYELAEPDEG